MKKKNIDNPEFLPELVKKKSSTTMSLCMWCRVMDTYVRVAKDVETKKAALKKEQDHKITKAKESDRYDLCKVLQMVEGQFTTDDNLLPQTLGQIQQECETLSEIHTLAHHRS